MQDEFEFSMLYPPFYKFEQSCDVNTDLQFKIFTIIKNAYLANFDVRSLHALIARVPRLSMVWFVVSKSEKGVCPSHLNSLAMPLIS